MTVSAFPAALHSNGIAIGKETQIACIRLRFRGDTPCDTVETKVFL